MLDLNKPVQTRDGRRARIICQDRKDKNFPVVALITDTDRKELVFGYTRQGRYYSNLECNWDLVNVPERHIHADLIIAWANGAKIQYLLDDDSWEDVINPTWQKERTYRIKP